jgi:tetratricopeptide (TPR) repeat protein
METKTKNRFFSTISLPNYEFTIKAPEFRKEGEEFTVWFLEGILENNPNYIDCLMYLGTAYTEIGMYEKGLLIDLKLGRLKPNDPLIHYNLACSHALLKNTDAAFDALERAIMLGYKDVYHLEKDKDLACLRKDSRYKKLIEKIKKH